jgi:hypothetical protein
VKYLCLIIGSLSLSFFCGCGGGEADAPNLVAASGVVLYKDKPISGATVTFMVEGAPIATGSTNDEGKFSLTTGGRPGAPLGNAKVAISKVSATAVDLTAMKPNDMADMASKGKMVIAEQKEEIPKKYSNPEKSGLIATLDANGEKNVFEFRLVD